MWYHAAMEQVKTSPETLKKFTFTESERQMLKDLDVAVLVLFGSQAQGVAGPMSDYDIGVILSDPAKEFPGAARSKIYDALYDLLSAKIQELVDIDIVFLRQAPMELRSHVVRYGALLHETDNNIFANFKERTMLDYADFAPHRRIFQQATLDRIS